MDTALDDVRGRLTSIESAVVRMADALELVARMDERVLKLIEHKDDHEDRIRKVEAVVAAHSFTQSAWGKFIWIIVAAAVGFTSSFAKDWMVRPAIVQPYHYEKANEEPAKVT